MLLELATFSTTSAPIAERCGVQRLELCEDYSCGGLTPSVANFEKVRHSFSGKIFVMIRPRAGGYIYSDDEFNGMLFQVRQFHAAGADGFVVGFFKSEQEIHAEQLKKFIAACNDKPVTFHRSFDQLNNWKTGIDSLVKAGCSRLLTSGNGSGAVEGRFRIAEMMQHAGESLIILPGGGIRPGNVDDLFAVCQPSEIHSAALQINGSEVVDESMLIELMEKTRK